MDGQTVSTPLEVVRRTLTQRGFQWLSGGQTDQVLCSPGEQVGFWGSKFKSYLHREKFRKLLYWLLDRSTEGPFESSVLQRQIGVDERTLTEFLSALREDLLVTCTGNLWSATENARTDSFGHTFEWFVAETFRDRLEWHATHAVYLGGTGYNDFDVVAVSGSDVAIVECKISIPTTEKEVEPFRERHNFLNPAFSLLLADTRNSVEELAQQVGQSFYSQGGVFSPLSDHKCLWWGARNLYVGNTSRGKHGVFRTLQACFRHYNRYVKGRSFTGSSWTS